MNNVGFKRRQLQRSCVPPYSARYQTEHVPTDRFPSRCSSPRKLHKLTVNMSTCASCRMYVSRPLNTIGNISKESGKRVNRTGSSVSGGCRSRDQKFEVVS